MNLFLPIDTNDRDALIKLPEDGMGWQWARVSDGMVLEETIIVGASYALNTAGLLDLGLGEGGSREAVKVVMDNEAESSIGKVAMVLSERRSRGRVGGDFWEKTLEGPTEFYRYCASPEDPRIGDDGSVVKGTYATTETEKPMVPSGLAAVGRFSLPIRMPAKFVVSMVAPAGTPIRYRTVTPNFGLCGGGVEVLFPEGLPPASASVTKLEIPEM